MWPASSTSTSTSTRPAAVCPRPLERKVPRRGTAGLSHIHPEDFEPGNRVGVEQDLVEAAAELYETVAAHDGTPEKLEAARRLEALLAFTLQVDGDRFTH